MNFSIFVYLFFSNQELMDNTSRCQSYSLQDSWKQKSDALMMSTTSAVLCVAIVKRLLIWVYADKANTWRKSVYHTRILKIILFSKCEHINARHFIVDKTNEKVSKCNCFIQNISYITNVYDYNKRNTKIEFRRLRGVIKVFKVCLFSKSITLKDY